MPSSVELAKINGAVISADSMQVYRHMDIGSAKITPEEMQGVTHYMIDELEPDEEFPRCAFCHDGKRIFKRNLCGWKNPDHSRGTGFYIQALLYDIDFTEQQCDETYRRQLEDLAREHGAEYLHGILREVDPASAEAIHANNIKRVIRALEFYHLSGKKYLSTTKRNDKTVSIQFCLFCTHG